MFNDKKILSIITARKGSKEIPGKNHKELMGKPLFIWSVLASLYSKYVDITVVSSNCEQVKKCFLQFIKNNKIYNNKLYWIERPEEISGDLSKNEEALLHAYNEMTHNKFYASTIINLQPTSPVRNGGLLDNCIETYYKGNYDSLLTGLAITPFLWRYDNQLRKWKYADYESNCCNRKMRQEFFESEFLYHDDGSIFIVDVPILISRKCRIGYIPVVYKLNKLQSLQIDTEFDFQLIENMAKVLGLNSLI